MTERLTGEVCPQKLVRLKNGIEELIPLVATVMFSLRSLMEKGKGIVVYELAKLCKDRDHKPWGGNR